MGKSCFIVCFFVFDHLDDICAALLGQKNATAEGKNIVGTIRIG